MGLAVANFIQFIPPDSVVKKVKLTFGSLMPSVRLLSAAWELNPDLDSYVVSKEFALPKVVQWGSM